MSINQDYQTILVGIDGSEVARSAFQKALSIAKANQGRLIITHIIENGSYDVGVYTGVNEEMINQETMAAKNLLKEYEEEAKAQNCPVETVLAYGSSKELLTTELPKKYQVDLIMIGQSGLNAIERFVIGSVSDYVTRNASCDVLVVR